MSIIDCSPSSSPTLIASSLLVRKAYSTEWVVVFAIIEGDAARLRTR